MNVITDSVFAIFNSFWNVFVSFMPNFIAGLLILFIGLVVSSLVRDLVKIAFKYLKFGQWLEIAGVMKEKELAMWPGILSELARWTVIFVFLMSAVDTWGVPKVGEVLNELLNFLPNVFVAVVIGLAGLIVARFVSDIVRHGIDGVGDREALILANTAKFSIIFFTTLIILTQLGVAADLVKILFTGIVGMLALAFGLAFGLGGQDEAKNILKGLREKINKKAKSKK